MASLATTNFGILSYSVAKNCMPLCKAVYVIIFVAVAVFDIKTGHCCDFLQKLLK
jgi:hypothetical protein